jgi:hypothetical protein
VGRNAAIQPRIGHDDAVAVICFAWHGIVLEQTREITVAPTWRLTMIKPFFGGYLLKT